jgi:hypothetical protein
VNQGDSENLFFIVHEGLVEVSAGKFFFWGNELAMLKAGKFLEKAFWS